MTPNPRRPYWLQLHVRPPAPPLAAPPLALDLLVVGGFDRSLLRQELIVGRNSDGIVRGTSKRTVGRGIRSTSGTTAPQGWNCRLLDSGL